MLYTVMVNGKKFDVEIEKRGEFNQAQPMQQPVYAQPVQQPIYAQPMQQMQQPVYTQPQVEQPQVAQPQGNVEVKSPLPGSIFDICVNIGDTVTAGQTLLIVEAMKMENEIVAPQNGTVKQILVSKGTMVDGNDILVVLC